MLQAFDFENLSTERRQAIAKTIRTIDAEEMKKLGNQLFKYADDPWRDKFFHFVAENAGCTYFHAVTQDDVNLLYCRDKHRGIWFLPGSGLGPLQERGLGMMKEVCEGKH